MEEKETENRPLSPYSNCGHNIDTDLTEELAEEADRFLRQASGNGKWYVFPDAERK